ncbi:MAG: hypothetical protein ACREJC_20635 [Tepidisphaeraceae bacterium]
MTGRLNVPVMKQENPTIIALDYLRPLTESSWTRYVRDHLGYGSISAGAKALLDGNGADGLMIDTPFETEYPWQGLKVIDEIRAAIHPKILMPNFGDADTWMGRTSVAKALAGFTDWHLVEMWIDLQRYTLAQAAMRVQAVEKALANGKELVLGLYDNGQKFPQKAAQFAAHWPDRVYWTYKISTTKFELGIPVTVVP